MSKISHFLVIVFVYFTSSTVSCRDYDAGVDVRQREELSPSSSNGSNSARPLYNIGHMANDIPQADQFLADGANALEVDVRFHSNGIPSKVYHGYPCDCFRDCRRNENAKTYIAHIRERSTPGSGSYTNRLAMLMFDLKLNDVDNHETPLYAAGDSVASFLIDDLYLNGTSNTQLWVILGIPYTNHSPAINGFRDAFKRRNVTHLLDKIGYEVTEESNMDLVQQTLRGLQINQGIWQGDGITNCVFLRSDSRLRQAIAKRDSPSGPWVSVDKVYRWTIDTKVAMRHTLRLGVDGIMTNDPDDLYEVIREPEFANKYRLATNEDNPLVKIVGRGPLRVGCSRNWCWKDCSYTGKWCWTEYTGCSSDPDKCTLDLECSSSCGK
ncbi:hypothetical protein CHUAL_006681 [Chamberlinius hualienensis]